jgi:hypothetical protein
MSHFGSDAGFGPTIDNGDKAPSRSGADHIDGTHTSIMSLLCGSFDPDADRRDIGMSEGLTNSGHLEMHEDNLAPARGVILGTALSTPFWAIVSICVYALLH